MSSPSKITEKELRKVLDYLIPKQAASINEIAEFFTNKMKGPRIAAVLNALIQIGRAYEVDVEGKRVFVYKLAEARISEDKEHKTKIGF